MRPSGREPNQLRPVSFKRNFTRYAEGSVLVSFGHTQVLCNATIEDKVPPFLRNSGKGWVTAEYAMLPRATHSRSRRESASGKPNGRSQEIQRLVGRSLRSIINLEALGERTVIIDCDVIQADGGTRTASITGAYVALQDALYSLRKAGKMKKDPLMGQLAAVSVGIYRGEPVLDLDYDEDSEAETDMNIVMNDGGGFVEVQGTAEGHAFRREELDTMLDLASGGIRQLFEMQNAALALELE